MTDRQKFDILDDFAPRIRNVELGLGATRMHGEHGWTRIRDRNSNTQLIMGFGNDLIFIWFYRKKKCEIWKSDFF